MSNTLQVYCRSQTIRENEYSKRRALFKDENYYCCGSLYNPDYTVLAALFVFIIE